MRKSVLMLIAACLICTACDRDKTAAPQDIHLELGDTKAVMLAKMEEIGARDVTSKTQYQFYRQISGVQEYYWWELEDKTIVAVLLAGIDKTNLSVVTIEIGESGKGIKGIANWRSQKLKRITSIPDKALPEK